MILSDVKTAYFWANKKKYLIQLIAKVNDMPNLILVQGLLEDTFQMFEKDVISQNILWRQKLDD